MMVSIIVPVYKVEEYLEKCVQSIRSQTYTNLEIILVDDGSPDNCGILCEELAKKDERIRVIHKENGGLGDARNAGVRKACGKYLLFVDSDDTIDEKLVETVVKTAEEYRAEIVMFDYVSVEKDGTASDVFSAGFEPDKLLSAKEEPSLVMRSCSAVNKLYLRSFWLALGEEFPKGKYYEDLATIPKIMAAAGRIVYKKEALYYYLLRDGSIMHSKNFEKNYADRTEALDHLLAFFRTHGLYEAYEKELEYMVFEHGYFVPSKEIVLNDSKSKYLRKFREYAEERFPEMYGNPYIRKLSGKDRILYMLLKHKMYGMMRLMSYARRAKDRLTGK